MLIADRNGMVSTKKFMPTTRDYVQSDLVAMWDGIENAGWGTHDAVATTWVDLVSNTSATSPLLSSNGNSMNYNGMGQINLLTGLVAAENFTFEACLKVSEATEVGTDRTEMMYAFGFTTILKYGTVWCAMPAGSYDYYATAQYTNPFVASFQINGYSDNVSWPRMSSMYYNGAHVREHFAKNVTGTTVSIGRNTYSQINMDMYNIRVYNRALTAAEIAANYAVDKERFNLMGGGGRKCLIFSPYSFLRSARRSAWKEAA